jgi:bacteriorhodopsin
MLTLQKLKNFILTILVLLPNVSAPFLVIQLFSLYMGSVSTISAVKWLWFLISIGALAGYLLHVARIFKASADVKGGEVAQLYGRFLLPFRLACVPVCNFEKKFFRALQW